MNENDVTTRKTTESLTPVPTPPHIVIRGIVALFRPPGMAVLAIARRLYNRPVLLCMNFLGWMLAILYMVRYYSLVVIAGVCILLGGCGGGGSAITHPVERVPLNSIVREPTNGTAIEKADDEVNRLKGELREAEAKADTERRHANEARVNGLKTLLTWLTAALILVAVISAVAAFWLGMLKTLGTLSAACLGGVIVAQTTSILLNHLMLAACILGGLALLAALFVLWKHRQTWAGLLAAVEVVEASKPATETPSAKAARQNTRADTILRTGGKAAFAGIESALKARGLA